MDGSQTFFNEGIKKCSDGDEFARPCLQPTTNDNYSGCPKVTGGAQGLGSFFKVGYCAPLYCDISYKKQNINLQ